LVGPLEVKQLRQRLPYPDILKLPTAGVEEQGLGCRRQPVGDFSFLYPAGRDCWEIITLSPVRGGVVHINIKLIALEGFKGDGQVPVKIETNFIEIVSPALGRQVSSPIVRHPGKGDGAAVVDLGDAVGSAQQWRLQ